MAKRKKLNESPKDDHTPPFRRVLQHMKENGTEFEKALARAWLLANEDDHDKLKEAFRGTYNVHRHAVAVGLQREERQATLF